MTFSSSNLSPPSSDNAPSITSSSSSSLDDEAFSSSRRSTNEQQKDDGNNISKVEFRGASRVVFKASTSPQTTTDEDRPLSPPQPALNAAIQKYQDQAKVWLAQLLSALRNLHEMGIVRKDMTTDDLLLSSTGDVVVTYASKWNLVDERLNRRAIDEFYSAPGKK